MNTIDTEKLARGWGLIAEGAMEISLAYSAIEPPVARAGVSESGSAQVGPPQLSPTPTDVQAQHVETRLGVCPVHGVPWTVRPAGVSKAGKPYKAFWKCSERDANGFCDQRPAAAWADAHPPSVAA
jgi:hypothetical protein